MPSTHPVWLWRVGALATPTDTCVGWQDVPLAGRVDAGPAAKTIGPITAIYASDLTRSRKTARALARVAGCNVRISKALRAADHGDWTGLSWSLIERQDPQRFKAYMDDWATTAMPGGESYADVATRIQGWWQTVEADGPIAVVSDLQPLRVLAATICGWTAEEAIAMHLARGHLACFDPKGEAQARWNLTPGR